MLAKCDFLCFTLVNRQMEICRNLDRGIGQESFWQECQEVMTMLGSKLTRLIVDFEESLRKDQPPPPVRELLTKVMLTFPPAKAPDESGDWRKREEAERNVVGAFADHLEELMFADEARRLIKEGSTPDLLARATVTSGNGEKLLARWQMLCEMLTTDSTPCHEWIRYRYSFGCRDRFLAGVMTVASPLPEIVPQLLELCTSALGVGAKPRTSVDDGGSYETATLTTTGDKVANYVRGCAKEFGTQVLLAEVNRIYKLGKSGQISVPGAVYQTLNWALINALADRFGDTSPLMTKILRQVDRFFPQNTDVGKALAALQAVDHPT